MNNTKAKFLSAVLIAIVGIAPSALAFGLPKVPGAPAAGGGEAGGGASINDLFDKYIVTYQLMNEGQVKLAEALGFKEEAGKLNAAIARLKKDPSDKTALADIKLISAEIAAKIAEQSGKKLALTQPQIEAVKEGTLAYAVGGVTLVDLAKSAKSAKASPTDVQAIGKLKQISELPSLVKNVAIVLPNYIKLMKSNDIAVDSSISNAVKAF